MESVSYRGRQRPWTRDSDCGSDSRPRSGSDGERRQRSHGKTSTSSTSGCFVGQIEESSRSAPTRFGGLPGSEWHNSLRSASRDGFRRLGDLRVPDALPPSHRAGACGAGNVTEGTDLSELYQDGPALVPSHGHASLEEHIRTGLGCQFCLVSLVVRSVELVPLAGFVVWREEHDDCLRSSERNLKDA